MDHTNNNINQVQFLEAAYTIGINLAKTALWDGDRCNWTGSSVVPDNGAFQLAEKALGTDIYGGTSGIALFLIYLLEKKPDVLLQQTLAGAVNHLLSIERSTENSSYGYYGGELGVASALITIGEQTNNKEWETKGWAKLLNICSNPCSSSEVDVISGVAGAIPVLIRLLLKSNKEELVKTLTRCGDFLMQHATKEGQYWSWVAIEQQPALTGYSHGAAGAALALLELYHVTRNPSYYSAAMMGFNFERLHFNAKVCNWPDLRVTGNNSSLQAQTTQTIYGESWCHGAPGIALSRLRAWQITNDPVFKQEAEIALGTTHLNIYNSLIQPDNTANFSICHGVAGNADILLEGGKILGHSPYIQAAMDVGTYGFNRYHENGITWPGGIHDPNNTNSFIEAPGLMVGTAGTGYFYLRLAYPEIKSLLLL